MNFDDKTSLRVIAGWGFSATALVSESVKKTWFIFMAGVMVVSTGIAGEVSPCPVDTVPIQIMTPDYGGINSSVTGVNPSLSHFRDFVTAVTERVATQLAKENLCITKAKDTESMGVAAWERRSRLQFVHWPLVMRDEYIVPVMPFIGVISGCKISSPWIDLTLVRKPVPSIHAVVRWNVRQLLADQAVLAGVRNVPTGVAMPLNEVEAGQFVVEYTNTELSDSRNSAAKPIEERVPPDILWLLRLTPQNSGADPNKHLVAPAGGIGRLNPPKGISFAGKGYTGYTKIVLALLDRCFASNEDVLHYNNIIDIDDPALLEQYKIDMPLY
ncbi:MAG: hypothetical protein LBU53_09180 [Zoogloeaceae bacterium]|jgi:hypothetical protein|nr:hypothetical protein [Zoogloeaceae bacterium]